METATTVSPVSNPSSPSTETLSKVGNESSPKASELSGQSRVTASFTESSTPVITDLPKGAYPISGKGVPAQAKPLPNPSSGTPSVKSPVSTVHCSISTQYGVTCGDDGLLQSGLHGTNENDDDYWAVTFTHSEQKPIIDSISDTPDWITYENAVTPLNIGDVYIYANYVLAVTPEGLTVWSSKTNHGVFMDGKKSDRFSNLTLC